MLRILCIAVAATGLLVSPDVHQPRDLQPQPPPEIPPDQTIAVLPDFANAGQTSSGGPAQEPAAAQDSDTHRKIQPPKEQTLQEESRLDILRNVSGEYA